MAGQQNIVFTERLSNSFIEASAYCDIMNHSLIDHTSFDCLYTLDKVLKDILALN